MPVARVHAELWAWLVRRGSAIGRLDLWIGATALAHGLGVVTRNERDFARVPGLRVLVPGPGTRSAPNVYEPVDSSFDGLDVARVGERAGSERLGMSVYEPGPDRGWSSTITCSARIHYHLQREELLVVLRGTVSLRTASG